jgi:hypothetical protein
MKAKLVLSLTIFSLVSAVHADVHSKLLKDTAERTNRALIAGDYATVAELTCPRLVDLMGGRAKLVASMQSAVTQMKSQGIVFKSATIDNPSAVVTNKNGQLFAIVPFSLAVAVPLGIATQKSYLIANSVDRGRNWTFVDGGNVDPSTLGQVFPSLPPNLKLPAKQDPVLQRTTTQTVSPKPATPAGPAGSTPIKRSTNSPAAKPAQGSPRPRTS